MTNDETKSWGRLIKYYRQQQNSKQDDVAVGICTSSYLSRIENGVVIAEPKVYELLFRRLGIDLQQEQNERNKKIAFLEQLYEKLISNEALSDEEILQMKKIHTKQYQQVLAILAGLIYTRYLLAKNNLKEANDLIQTMTPFITWRNDRVTQLYVSITAFAYLSNHQFIELVEKEKMHHNGQFLLTASAFERANYEYHLAFASHRCYMFQQALVHIENATRLFSHQYKPLFQLKLYSMKGVIYNDLHCFHEAHIEFDAGLDLLSKVAAIQSPIQWSSLHNNIAYCFECQGLFGQAMYHYEQANEHEEDLLSVINWMRTCYQQGDLEKLNALLLKYPEHHFHVTHQIYQRQLLQFASRGKLTIQALKELEEWIFPYFDEQQYYSLVLYYAPVWGDFYEQLHAYKQANSCYKRALEASEKVRQRMSS